MGCHALLQGIFPTQGWNSGLLHCGPILYHLRHQGSPKCCGSLSNQEVCRAVFCQEGVERTAPFFLLRHLPVPTPSKAESSRGEGASSSAEVGGGQSLSVVEEEEGSLTTQGRFPGN